MQCRYCQNWNEEDERRCVRCGRRLHLSSPRPAPDSYPTAAAATALALESIPGRQTLAAAPQARPNYQPSLFRDAAYRDGVAGPKVVPIPMLTPSRPPVRTEVPTRKARPAAPRSPRRDPASQQSLDFYQDKMNPAAALGTEVHAVIYCDAPVALPAHRMIAAAFDLSMVLIAVGLFLGVFFLSGDMLMLSKENAPFLISVAALLGIFYRFLCRCSANGETPSMRFYPAGLRLVNFGRYRAPDRDQRAFRQVSSLLSVLSAGLGLVWALVDEESLTWHDHISKDVPDSRATVSTYGFAASWHKLRGGYLGAPDAGTKRELSAEAAEFLLVMDFDDRDQSRMLHLAERSNAGALTADEQTEFDGSLHVGNLLAVMKSKARLALKKL